jgi:hypothetical protein
MKIRQRKDDCHYETSIEENGLPLVIGYGFTQEEADTKALYKLKVFLKSEITR